MDFLLYGSGSDLFDLEEYLSTVTALRSAGLVAQPASGKKGRISLGFTLFALAVIVTFVLLLLVMLGVI